MSGERRRRFEGWLAGLLAATVLLSVPASSFAAKSAPAADQLAAAGTLAPGAGYGSHAGSQPVRVLQLEPAASRATAPVQSTASTVWGRRGQSSAFSRRTVSRPTESSARRRRDGCSLRERSGRWRTRLARRTWASSRAVAVRGNPAESAIEQNPAHGAPSAALSRAGPASSEGVPTELLALLAALASAALLIGLRTYGRRVGEATVNFGMACAALLATFVIGAATGAVFATQAAPDSGGEAFADSGALLAARGAPSHLRAREAREVQAQVRV